MSATLSADGAICRLDPTMTPEQARAWAERLLAQACADPEGRGPRYWGSVLGLAGHNLDRVLAELGEPPAPPRRPMLGRARAYFVRRLLLPLALPIALAMPGAAQDAPGPAPSPPPAPCDPAVSVCLSAEGWLMTTHTWAQGTDTRSLVGGRLQAELRWRRWRWAVRGDATGTPGEYEPGKPETVRAAEVHLASAWDALRIPDVATVGPAVAVGAAVALEQNEAGVTPTLPNRLTAGLGLRASWPRGWLYAVAGVNEAIKGFAVTGTWQIAVSDRVASIGTVAVGGNGAWVGTTGVGVRWK